MLVCTGCGYVIEDQGQLRMDDRQAFDLKDPKHAFMSSYKNVPRSVQNKLLNDKYGTASKEQARRNLVTWCDHLKLSKDMTLEAKTMFNEALSTQYYNSFYSTRQCVATAIIYIVLAKYRATTVSEVCNVSGISTEDFSGCYFRYLGVFPDYAQGQPPLSIFVPHILKELNFEESERDAITKKTIKIIELLRDMEAVQSAHNFEGKQTKLVIIAAAYLAWKSLNLRKRRNVYFSQFADMYNIHSSQKNSVAKRIVEMAENLVLLTKYFNWIKFSVINTKNVILELDKILENADWLATQLKLDDLIKKKPLLGSGNVPMPSAQRPQCPDLNATTDVKIEDAEIDRYIRSPLEVKQVAAAKRRFEAVSAIKNEREKNSGTITKKTRPPRSLVNSST